MNNYEFYMDAFGGGSIMLTLRVSAVYISKD
jgi:hypothetical protein